MNINARHSKALFTTLALLTTSALSTPAQAARFDLDKAHANVEFRVKHLMVSTVKGRFNSFEGGFDYDSKAKKVKDVSITIDVASIDTNNKDRDDHLRKADFFEVEKNPKMTFVAKEFSANPKKSVSVKGDLTIKGITKPVTLTGTFLGETLNPFNGQPKVGFELKGKINRKDWGLTWNKALEAGGVAVGEDVEISIDAEADAAAPAKAEAPKAAK